MQISNGRETKKMNFPILKQKVNGKRLVYLDNAATSQKPQEVIDSIANYYKTINANTHRGIHTLATKATDAFENTRAKVAKFINADTEEVIFTKGTTEGLNIVAFGLKHLLKKGDEIVLTVMEHHSNLVPWQQVAKETGSVLKFIPIKNYELDMSEAKKLITSKTKIVSVMHMSNVLGTINPIEELAKLTHKQNAIFVVDAAQSVPHMKIDVKKIDCDFLAFSGHKIYAPMGIGVLFGKMKLLEELEPFNYGGHMIRDVSLNTSTWNDIPWKFEAGTQNVEGVVGLGTAIDFVNKTGLKNIEKQEQLLTTYALKEIQKIKQIQVIGPMKNRGALISFHIEGMHPHDISELLDREGVAIRGGHHCCMVLHKTLGLPGTSRASFAFYNTKQDVDAFILALKKAIKVFKL